MKTKTTNMRQFVRNPYTVVSIKWLDVKAKASGSTECEAWRGQFEIEKLEKQGFRVLDVLPA